MVIKLCSREIRHRTVFRVLTRQVRNSESWEACPYMKQLELEAMGCGCHSSPPTTKMIAKIHHGSFYLLNFALEIVKHDLCGLESCGKLSTASSIFS